MIMISRLLPWCVVTCLSVSACNTAGRGAASPLANRRPHEVTGQGSSAPATTVKEFDSTVAEGRPSSLKLKEKTKLGKAALSSLQFHDANHGWAASEDGNLYATVDGGQTWRALQIGIPPGAYLVDLFFINPLLGWTVLGKYQLGSPENRIWIFNTTDGGKSWRVQHEGAAAAAARIVFLNEREGWLVGEKTVGARPIQQTNLVLHTSDQGTTWADVSNALNRLDVDDNGRVQDFVRDIVSVGPNSATLITRRRNVFTTNDGGQSWLSTAAIKDEPDQTCVCQLGVMNSNKIWVGGGADSREGMGGVLVSAGQDNSWVKYRAEGFYFSDIIYISDNKFLAGGSMMKSNKKTGVILFTSDGGRNWEIIYEDTRVERINKLAHATSNTFWAAGEDGVLIRLDSDPK